MYFVQNASRVLTKEEREAAWDEIKRLKELQQNETEERKTYMQMMDINRKENEELSDLDQVNVFITYLSNTVSNNS